MTSFDEGLWTRLVDEHDADRVGLATVESARTTRRAAVGLSGIGALAAAGTAAAVMSLSSGARPAFAGWTAHPHKATADEISAANAYCTSNMGFPKLPLQLSEERGGVTSEIFAGGTQNDFCMVGPSFENSSGFETSSPVQVASGQLHFWAAHTFANGGQPYGTMIAQAAGDVSAVELTLDDGSQVTATLQNGWVVAWWPGSARLVSVQLTTPSGTHTQTFNRCQVENCVGGPHGGAPGGGPGGG